MARSSVAFLRLRFFGNALFLNHHLFTGWRQLGQLRGGGAGVQLAGHHVRRQPRSVFQHQRDLPLRPGDGGVEGRGFFGDTIQNGHLLFNLWERIP
jgi:hypothetical protein